VIVLDTTVLVYAKGADHSLRDPCRALVRAVGEGELSATTTVQVIQELAHVRARRRTRTDAASLACDYAELLSPLLAVGEDDLRAGMALFERQPAIGAFDAVLAAAAIAQRAEALVSADRAFGAVGGLRHLLPDADGVRTLVGR